MRRPSFQFYPGDWMSNAKLKPCTHAERGIWISVLCLMHDSEEYGVLRWPLDDLARAVGCKVSALQSLTVRRVLKGSDSDQICKPFVFTPRHAGRDGNPVVLIDEQPGPLWYSSRMVRDEYVRTKRGIGTRFGDEPKDTPKPPIGDGPSSSASTSVNLTTLSGKPDAQPLNGHFKAEAGGILMYLNEKAGRSYRPVPANIDLIAARLKEGATADELRAVVASKCAQWLADETMAQYLRPATLFNRTKFAQYQGELGPKAQPERKLAI